MAMFSISNLSGVSCHRNWLDFLKPGPPGTTPFRPGPPRRRSRRSFPSLPKPYGGAFVVFWGKEGQKTEKERKEGLDKQGTPLEEEVFCGLPSFAGFRV
eukprot:169699-Amphidinium_carterae.1